MVARTSPPRLGFVSIRISWQEGLPGRGNDEQYLQNTDIAHGLCLVVDTDVDNRLCLAFRGVLIVVAYQFLIASK